MKYVIATIACLAFASAVAAGATRTSSPLPAPEPGTEQALFCQFDDIVCINHTYWCEPPGSKPVLLGGSC